MIRDKIHESEEYKAMTGQPASTSGASGGQSSPSSATVGAAMAPVLEIPRDDAELYLDVLTVVLLFLIWREVAR